MEYTTKSHPTTYKDILFRSRLEARWAAFFDLVGWTWEYEPIDLNGWTPDFRVEFPCGHSECPTHHVLLVEVKPYYNIEDFEGHPCMNHPFGDGIPADASAAFGINPHITYWEMCHGAGGGIYSAECFCCNTDIDYYWKMAGGKTQYMKPRKETIHEKA